MSEYGKNVTQLMTRFLAVEAIPSGGGFEDGIEFFVNAERRKQVIEAAKIKTLQAIALVKTAPDNPYGDDDELIAGELLRRIAERDAQRGK